MARIANATSLYFFVGMQSCLERNNHRPAVMRFPFFERAAMDLDGSVVMAMDALVAPAQIADRKAQMFCLWAGAAFFPLYLIGFVFFCRFLPLPAPTLDAAQITAFFALNRISILIGMSICNVAAVLPIFLAVAMYGQMTRIEKGIRTFSFVQLGAGVWATVFFSVPGFVWLALAYRTGHNPDTVLLLDDFAWIAWVVSWAPFAVQFFAFGICILLYGKDEALFPSWSGWMSVGVAVALMPASFVVFFKSGPFAWDGLIGLYTPLVAYLAWFVATVWVLHRAINTSLMR